MEDPKKKRIISQNKTFCCHMTEALPVLPLAPLFSPLRNYSLGALCGLSPPKSQTFLISTLLDKCLSPLL